MRGTSRVRRLAAKAGRAASARLGRAGGGLTAVVTVGPRTSRAHLAECRAALEAQPGTEVVVVEVDSPSELGPARLEALARAREHVVLLDADHVPTRHGYPRAVDSLRESGSDVALLAQRAYRRGHAFPVDDVVRARHGVPTTAATPAARPAVLAEWEGAVAVLRTESARRLSPEDLGDDATLLAAAVAAGRTDVLSEVGAWVRVHHDRGGPTWPGLDAAGLRRVVAAVRRAHEGLVPLGGDAAARHTAYAAGGLLHPWLEQTFHDDTLLDEARRLLPPLRELAGPAWGPCVPAYDKALHHLLATGGPVRDFLGQVRAAPRLHPTEVGADGGVVGFPGWEDLPRPARVLADHELGVRAEVVAARVEDDDLVLEGWAYVDHVVPDADRTVELVWVSADGRRVPARVDGARDPRADRASGLAHVDVSECGLVARTPRTDLHDGAWDLHAAIVTRGRRTQGRVTVRPWHLAAMPATTDRAGRGWYLDHDDLQHLSLHVRNPIRTVSATGEGGSLVLTASGPGVSGLALQPARGRATDLAVTRHEGGVRAVLDTTRLDPRLDHTVVARGDVDRDRDLVAASTSPLARPARRGGLVVRAAARAALVTEVRLETDTAVVRLSLDPAVPGWRMALTLGVRAVRGEVVAREDGGFEARVRLRAAKWGGPELPLPSGEYVVSVANDVHTDWVPATPADDLRLCAEEVQPSFRLRPEVFGPDRPGVRLVVAPPLADDELGERQQRLLRGAAAVDVADRHGVFFRAMFGEHTSGNGLGVHEELRRRGSDLDLVWAVADRSVAVPDGGVGVVERSRAWHEAVARSRYHMVDVHQVEFLRRPREQVLIQTMHGYPWKVMGHDWWRKMPNSVQEIGSLDRRTRDWSVLVSPAAYATPLLRAAFLDPAGASETRVLETGYPRNDLLLRPEAADVRAATRAALGLSDDQVVVLYAPTFRDYLSAADFSARGVTFFDVQEALAALPDHYVVLRRGHAFTARVRDDRLPDSDRFLDVTDHPDVNHLVLASDVGVLDYSSLRFDYVLSGRPMVFLVPDLEEYDRHRGGVIPFAPTAPGPWTQDTAGTVTWLRDLERLDAEYAAARQAFRESYVEIEDGRSAARLVDEVFVPRGDGLAATPRPEERG